MTTLAEQMCKKCGEKPPRSQDKGLCYDCAVCADCGQRESDFKFFSANDGRIVLCFEHFDVRVKARNLSEAIEKNTKKAGFYASHKKIEQSDLAPEQAEVCKEYLSLAAGNLFLTGPSGCGKTWTAVAIAKGLISQERSVRFISVPWMFAQLRDSIANEKKFSMTDYVENLLSFDYLVLDDIGANRATDWAVETLYLIMDQWDANEKPGVILTSNMTLGKVSEIFGDRIASRIAHDCKVVSLKGQDKRISK